MKKEEFIEEAAKRSQEIVDDIFIKYLKDKSKEYRFKFGGYFLSSLIADFVEAIIDNNFSDAKIELIDDIIRLSELLLQVKESQRKHNNQDSPH